MAINEILALIIGLSIAVGSCIVLVFPDMQKKLWRKTKERPDYAIRAMGTAFIIAGIFLVIFALESADASTVVVAAAAGWCLFIGLYAFAVKPIKSAVGSFPKVNRMLMQLSNILAVIVGALIVYIVLK